jgi:hypothetical protein
MHFDKVKYVMLILFDILIVHFLHSVYLDYFIYSNKRINLPI